jgi:hypothetical protein
MHLLPRRLLFIAAALFAAFMVSLAPAPCHAVAGREMFSLGFVNSHGQFNVIEGKPYLLHEGEHGPAGNAIDFREDRLVHLASGNSLTYPLGGEDPRVSLGKSGEISGRWDFGFDVRDRARGTIRAADGKFKGWYLDWSDEETEVTADGKRYHVRVFKLVKDPKEPRQFRAYVVSP